MHGYYVHPNRQHPPSTRSRPSENLWKTTIQIHLPPVVLAVLNPIECSGQSSCAMPRGLASETAERTRESANPISRTDCHAWKRYPFWALLSGRRNVICFWRKSSLQCMRLTSVYWFKFGSRHIMICTGQVLSYPCTATRHQTPKKSVSQAMASFSEERLNVQRNCSFNNSFYKIRLSRCSQTVPAIDAITSLALWGKRTRYLRGSVRTDRM